MVGPCWPNRMPSPCCSCRYRKRDSAPGVAVVSATATIWAITSTVSGNGDQGADPNQLVMITDNLAATGAPAGESFATIRIARFGEVFRGVSFTPGTDRDRFVDADDDRSDDHH